MQEQDFRGLYITLDETNDSIQAKDASGHTFTIPCTENGVRVMKQVLRAQIVHSLSAANMKAKFASVARPTQDLVNEFLKNRELERANEAKKQENELREMF